MKKLRIFASLFAVMALFVMSSCSKDDDKVGDTSLFIGTWTCQEVTGVEWLISEGNMYIGTDGYFNYQNGFNYQVLAKPYSIVFRSYSFDDVDNPVNIAVAQYDIVEISATEMKLKCRYCMAQNENPTVANPFTTYPATLTFTKK